MAALMLGTMIAGATGVEAKKGGTGATVVRGEAFYVAGEAYRTVLTPTDLSHTGAPDHSFDIIYGIGHGQLNVANAAPGLPGYNGGRWMVIPVSFADYDAAVATYGGGNGVFDSAAEVEAAIAGGAASAGAVAAKFVCPVIKL